MAGLIPFNRRRADILSSGFNDFQHMLDDFFTDGWPFTRSLAGDTFKIDVQDQDNEYIIEAELPGVKKSDINLSIEEGRLRISVNKREDIEEKSKNYIHRERRYSSMQRNILLADADPQGVKAKLEDGVLHIIVPKKQKPDHSINIDIE